MISTLNMIRVSALSPRDTLNLLTKIRSEIRGLGRTHNGTIGVRIDRARDINLDPPRSTILILHYR